MIVERAALKGFRNLSSLDLQLASGINILHGDNAQGKTSFLEALYLCSIGRSQRAHTDRELVNHNAENAYVRVFVNSEDLRDKIEIQLSKGGRKGVAVNGVPIKKLGQLFGTLLTVMFSPEDLRLIKSGPSERRRFMDVELCQLSPVYYHDLQRYYHVLKQRNSLLKALRLNKSLRDTVAPWNEQLVAYGGNIMSHRHEFIESLNLAAQRLHFAITQGKEELRMVYRPNISAAEYMDRLERGLDRDIALGSTSAGIHKDDIIFMVNGEDARVYGSQGQQRTAALAAKLAEMEIIKERKQTWPVLLLDDVLSELDESRQGYLLSTMEGVQTVLTCTGGMIKRLPGAARVYVVEDGKICQ